MPTPVVAFNQVELGLYGMPGNPPTSDIARVVSGLTDIGATWVRILLDWKLINTSPGVYDWTYLDPALVALTNAGIHVLLVPNDQPFWTPTPPAFATFVTKAAQRYGPGGVVTLALPVRHWEIWNEPNFFFGQPPNGGTVASMYAYQKAGYDAIKAVDSGAFVISAGLIPVPNGWFTTDAVTWLAAMYAAAPAGGPYPWDGVGFHPYSGTDVVAQEPTTSQQWIAEIPQLHQVIVKYSDGGKPIWPTEFGFEVQPSGLAAGIFVTPAVQAQWLVQEINNLQIVADKAGVTLGPMFLYNYRNTLSDNGASDGSHGMGVVYFDFTKKPSWSAIQTLISRGAPVGATSGGTIIKPARPTITMGGTGPTGVTVGGTIIKPGRPTITMSGTATPNVAATNWAAIGIKLNPVNVPADAFQSIADELTGVAGSSLGEMIAVMKAIAAAATSAGQTANNAAGNIATLINGLVGGAEAEIEALLASFSGTASAAAVATNQIAALWAHVSATNTAGIHYTFNSAVPLTNNYPGTTNPAWTAAGPLVIPTVAAGKKYVESTAATKGMVFTGNPNAAAVDHGLVTDRNQVYATIGSAGAFGSAGLFMSGHFVAGTLGENLMLQIGWGGPAAMRFYVCTGANSGLAFVGTQFDLPRQPIANDVIGMQHDGAGTFTMYFNNAPVGTPWSNGDGATLTLGPGYRDFGLILSDNGFGTSTINLADPVALDYV